MRKGAEVLTLIAMWRKGQRPRLKEIKKVTGVQVSSKSPDVHGVTCVHVNFKGEVCGESIEPGRQHGWLCTHHDQATRERTQVKAAA